jgi:ketosteroid isomerase-like protein
MLNMKAHFVVAAFLTFSSFASADTTNALAPDTVVTAQPLPDAPVQTPAPPDDPTLSPAQQQQVKEVKLANGAFFRAIELRDKSGLDKSLADEAVLSGAGAGPIHVDTKASFEKAVSAPAFPVKSIAVETVDVRLQSETVVAFGLVDLEIANGLETAKSQESFMNVFAKRHGKWELIVSYSAPIAAT